MWTWITEWRLGRLDKQIRRAEDNLTRHQAMAEYCGEGEQEIVAEKLLIDALNAKRLKLTNGGP